MKRSTMMHDTMKRGTGSIGTSRWYQFSIVLLALTLILAFTAEAQFGDPTPRALSGMDTGVFVPTGKLHYSVTDLAVPGRGLGFEFTRYWGHHNAPMGGSTATSVGRCWNHSYNWKFVYEQDPYGDGYDYYTVYTASCAKQAFKEDNGTYYRQPGVHASLEMLTSLHWVYTAKHGVRYHFEKTGPPWSYSYILTLIEDPNGNSLSLVYEDLSGWPRLKAVTDQLGRVLKLSYENTYFPRYITKVEFGLGTPEQLTQVLQTVVYEYYGQFLLSVHQLLSAGDPRSSELVTTYQTYYQIGQYDSDYILARITDPRGHHTEYTYSTDENTTRVLEMRLVDGSTSEVMRRRNYAYLGYTYASVYDFYDAQLGYYRCLDYYWSLSSTDILQIYVGSPVFRLDTMQYDAVRNPTQSQTSRGGGGLTDLRYIYAGTDQMNNSWMGNCTKVEQRNPSTQAVVRTIDTDYESTYNRAEWGKDAMGREAVLEYDTNGNLLRSTSKANTGSQPHAVDDIVTTYEYDSAGHGRCIRTALGDLHDNDPPVISETYTVYDPTYTYPIETHTTVTKDGQPHTIHTYQEWDTDRGWKTADIDAEGRRTEYTYWQDGKLKYALRVSDSTYTIPTYDLNGNVIRNQVRHTGNGGDWQTGTIIFQVDTEYDALNRVVKVHQYNNDPTWTTPYATTENVYDDVGNLIETIDARNLSTTYEYDLMGRLLKQTLPDGDWVETRYNALNQVTHSWTSQQGSDSQPAVSYTYDNLNRLSRLDYLTNEYVEYTYDDNDNTLTLTTHDGSQTYTYSYAYDQLNRLKEWENGQLARKAFYAYDDASNRTSYRIEPSAGGNPEYSVSYTYDEANRLLSVTDLLASKSATFDYLDIGALERADNPNGTYVTQTLNAQNRLELRRLRNSSDTILNSLYYQYKRLGDVHRLTRDDTGAGGSLKVFDFTYDDLSRMMSANYGDEKIDYVYDKSGNRESMTRSVNSIPDYTVDYTVASNSNQLDYRNLVPEDPGFSNMSYTYDAEGNLTSRWQDSSNKDDFTYSFGGQLTQIEKVRNGSTQQTIDYTYDGAGQRVKVNDSEGTRYFFYDGGMPVLELDANQDISVSYLYGANGTVYRRKHNGVAHFPFDENMGDTAHDPDRAHEGLLGNGVAQEEPEWVTDPERGTCLDFDGTDDCVRVPNSAALNITGNAITIECWIKPMGYTSGGAQFVYKNGYGGGYRVWLLSSGKIRFDLKAQAGETVTSQNVVPLNQWTHVAVRYNGSQMRVFLNGVVDPASYSKTGNIAGATTPLDIGRRYYQGGTHHYNGLLDDITIYDRALSDADILARAQGYEGRYEYQHTNALGSVILMTDDNQNVIARYEYDAFGAVRAETGTSDNTRKFTGKEWEQDTKLYYFAARYYDPYIGRFTQRDPAGDGANWYVYCRNNPMKFIDPTGTIAKWATYELGYRAVRTFAGSRLTATERGLARVMFGDSLNMNKVRVVRGRAGAAYVAAISARSGGAHRNTVFLNGKATTKTLMHELTHIWQWQSAGASTAVKGLWEGILHRLGAAGIYDASFNCGGSISDYGVEQLASVVGRITEDYLLKPIGKVRKSSFAGCVVPLLLALQGADGPVGQKYWGWSGAAIYADLQAAPQDMLLWEYLCDFDSFVPSTGGSLVGKGAAEPPPSY